MVVPSKPVIKEQVRPYPTSPTLHVPTELADFIVQALSINNCLIANFFLLKQLK